ncbi:MAG: cation transporter [Gemmatimonadetes bacterium]|jgi:copper chaperone CopZ|nr:cation transporter [Gemmatimonadota bacterium]MBP9106613.1 cation transporter [Gemmatimonadaceae bacterium]MBK6454686.1 cation transporter [Gemmatimonadota bacterium]MBK6840890.1 cation transporter [Gemmatimonadota bacterium]MBK7834567.1 cation transporter [Gemmatimonadota bacterium]
MMVTTLHITGMRSVHCARAVHTSLTQVEGIVGADVVIGKASLDHDISLDERALSAAVEAVGYTLHGIVTERRLLPLLPLAGESTA